MRLILHPKVHSDVLNVIKYYERVASSELADEFYLELRHAIQNAVDRVDSFPVQSSGLRRVNLKRFPYHILFCVKGDVVRVLVVRHHRRSPSLGVRRR